MITVNFATPGSNIIDNNFNLKNINILNIIKYNIFYLDNEQTARKRKMNFYSILSNTNINI